MRFELTLNDVLQVPDAISLIQEYEVPHVNVTDTSPGGGSIEIAGALIEGIPSLDLVLHVAAKHHDLPIGEEAIAAFVAHLVKAEEVGVRQFLIVSGHPRPAFDSLAALDAFGLLPTSSLAMCVYNPYLDGAAAEEEAARLGKKLAHPNLGAVYLQIGANRDRLAEAVLFIRGLRNDVDVRGSLPVPNEAMLMRLQDKPLHGVTFGPDFFDSVATATKDARELAAWYAEFGIDPTFFMSAFDRDNIEAALDLLPK